MSSRGCCGMNRKPCGYLVRQFRVNPTRLDVSLILLKVQFFTLKLRILSNDVSRTDEVNAWNQRSQFFSVFSFSIYLSNFSGLISRVIFTQLFFQKNDNKIKWRLRFRIIVKAAADKYENLRAYTHFTVHVNCFKPGMVTAEKRLLVQVWHCLTHINLLERLFKCFKLDATSLISATHIRGKDNSLCLPYLAYRIKSFVLPKVH